VPVELGSYLEAIRHDGDAFAAAARLGLDAPVPSCPGWSVADLVAHTGQVHRQKEQIVRELVVDNPPDEPEAPESGLIEWFEEGVDLLLDTLSRTDPEQPVWSWYDNDRTAGFWYRRMAHETVIHRADAELAHGEVGPIGAELAADGVDELVEVFMAGEYPDWLKLTETDRTIELVIEDAAGRWRLRKIGYSGTSPNSGNVYADEPGFVLDDGHGDSGAVVSGRARDMLLWTWGRGPLESLTVAGDPSIAGDLRSAAADATQ
jgi:uncharacterized protein (TIGR03083 family)